MARLESRSMDAPDETHTPDKLVASVVQLGTATVKRLTAEPGFWWSECVKPLVGGESCRSGQLGYVVEGGLHISADDGDQIDLRPGRRVPR